jgi:hypothetical protein
VILLAVLSKCYCCCCCWSFSAVLYCLGLWSCRSWGHHGICCRSSIIEHAGNLLANMNWALYHATPVTWIAILWNFLIASPGNTLLFCLPDVIRMTLPFSIMAYSQMHCSRKYFPLSFLKSTYMFYGVACRAWGMTSLKFTTNVGRHNFDHPELEVWLHWNSPQMLGDTISIIQN